MSDLSPEAVLALVEAAYRQHFTNEPARASVSFVGVEPIEILRFAESVGQTYLSLGMSRRPMTAGDTVVVDETGAPRAELMLSTVGPTDEVWRQLAVLAAAPAVQSSVYRSGDRIQLEQPLLPGSRCLGGVLAASELTAAADMVEVLRFLPATATELAWSRVHGSAALIELWQEESTPLRDLMREPVPLP